MSGNVYNTADLTALSTGELDDLLRMETAKPEPDDDFVLTILRILEEREKDFPLELTPGEAAAFERYCQSVNRRKLQLRKRNARNRWVVSAVSAAMLVLVIITAVPQKAQAETFWEMLQRWSDNILEMLNPREHMSSLDYHFETDNPGLQQVYDSVIELGITEPVVPMWLPNGYALTDIQSKHTPMLNGIWAWFHHGENEIVYKVNAYSGEPAHQYYKDDVHFEEFEKNGIIFRVTQNNGSWAAVWTKDNIECFISMDCQEETLRRVLGSIFEMEDYE